MTEYVFPPAPPASVAVLGTAARFPVRRIFCVGRNYADHVREMGGEPERTPPIFFTKPADAVADTGATIPYPPLTNDLHHEAELVIAIGAQAKAIAAERADEVIWGYSTGIDLTRRDLQAIAKKGGQPWDWAKAFDLSAPCGPLIPAAPGLGRKGRITLSVNGETRQDSDIAEMIWSVPEIVAACSAAVTLMPGDLIFTGTPAGVGPLVRGDRVRAMIEGLPDLEIAIG